MSSAADQTSYTGWDRLILTGTRVLTATMLTAFVGATANWIYERFFDSALYAAGNPLARGLFVIVVTFPFILGGLVILGLPASFVLRRLRLENLLTYALVGILTGIVWGATVVGLVVPINNPAAGVVDAGFGCVSMMFWWWLRPKTIGSSAPPA